MKTEKFFLCTLTYLCQSIIPAGSRVYRFLDPGIEKMDPGLQSLVFVTLNVQSYSRRLKNLYEVCKDNILWQNYDSFMCTTVSEI